MKYKNVIKQEDATYYVSVGVFQNFVIANSTLEEDTIDNESRKVFGEYKDIFFNKKPSSNTTTKFGVEWIGKFMDAHPYMKRIMFVFDD